MARLSLVLLGLVAALALAEGLVRVAAAVDPHVHFLATGRARRPAVAHATLEDFIAAQAAYITPHKAWYGHWSNALGFHDEEFVEPKAAGRRRVLAVGDSFTFAPVPYPQGVMTLAEGALRAACAGQDLDVLNMGIMGVGPPEYRILVELGAPRFAPDLVLIDFFVGNDAPDLHRHVHDRSPVERALRRSRAWTFGKNLVRAWGGLREARAPARVGAAPAGVTVGPGGARVAGTRDLAPDDPALVGPVFSEAAYRDILASDLGRFYRPRDGRAIEAAWRSTIADLDAIHRAATRAGSRTALAILPSVLQIDAGLRAGTVARLAGSLRYRGLSAADIDPDLPNGRLRDFARSRDIPLADLTPIFAAEPAGPGEPLYKRSDIHWTPRGNRVAARALAAFLAPLVCDSR